MENYIDFSKMTPMSDLIAAHGRPTKMLTETAGDLTFHKLEFEDLVAIPFSKSLNEFLAGGGKITSLSQLGQNAEFGSLSLAGRPAEEHSLAEFIQDL